MEGNSEDPMETRFKSSVTGEEYSDMTALRAAEDEYWLRQKKPTEPIFNKEKKPELPIINRERKTEVPLIPKDAS